MPSSNEELILEALAEVAPGGRHSIVIGEAMRNAGLLDVPSDAVAFRSFVQGPLRHAVHLVLGEVAAAQIIGRLVVDLSGTATDGTIPLGSQQAHTPSPPRQRAATKAPKRVASTLGYGEDAKSSVDVAIIGSDPTTQELLREMLSQRGYRLFAIDSVARGDPPQPRRPTPRAPRWRGRRPTQAHRRIAHRQHRRGRRVVPTLTAMARSRPPFTPPRFGMPMRSSITWLAVAICAAISSMYGCGGGEALPPAGPSSEPTAPAAGSPATAVPMVSGESAATEPGGVQDPPVASAPGVVKVTYRMGIPFGPCGKVLRTYVKSAQGWSLERKCDDPAGPPTTSEIDEKEFNATVYMRTRLASDPTLGEIALEAALGAGKRAPEGSVRCYRSSDGANTVCENAKGVITYSAFDGYKLNPPKRDANRSYRLVSYEEE